MRNPRRPSGDFVDGVHHLTFPVYYEDTDAGGVVYYANYLRFAERGRTEALHLAGIDHQELMADFGIWFVARRCVVDYLRPGRLDDLLTVKTSIRELKKSSLLMRQEIVNEQETICVVDAFMVCVNSDVKPQRIPDTVRNQLLEYMPVLGTNDLERRTEPHDR